MSTGVDTGVDTGDGGIGMRKGRLQHRRWSLLAGVSLLALGLATPAAAADWQQRLREIGSGAAPGFDLGSIQLAQAGRSEARRFDIPAGDLQSALVAFSQAVDLQLLYPAGMTAGLTTQGAQGEYTSEEALRRLLAGTGLNFRFTSADTVTLAGSETQPEPGPQRLGPVQVTATRTEQSISAIPGAVTVVDREQIATQREITNDIGRVLEQTVPGFIGPSGTRQQPTTIRGRSALVLINGVPQNQQLRTAGFDFRSIDPALIERIEVVRGASATYGFGGTGGIINIITRRPVTEELSFTTRVGTRFQPFEIDRDTFTIEVYQDISGRYGRFDYFAGGSFRRLARAFDAEGDLIPDENSEFNDNIADLNGNFGFRIDDDQALRFTANYFRDDGREGQLEAANAIPGVRKADAVPADNPDNFVADGIFNDPQTSTNFTLDYTHDDVLGSAVSAQAFYQRWFNTFDQDSTVFDCCVFAVGVSEREDRRIGFRLNIDTPIDFGPVPEGARVTWGLDYLNYFSSEGTDSNVVDGFFALRPDITQNSVAGFAQIEVPVGDFLLSGGVRHEHFFVDVDDAVLDSSEPGNIATFEGGSLDYSATLFNVGLVYFLTDEVELFAGFNQGFDVTQIGRAASQVDSADQIEPEPAVTDSYEVGVRIFEDLWQASLTGFFTDSELASRTINPGGELALAIPLRQPEQFWGIEATLDVQPFEGWAFGTSIAWQDGVRETEEDGEVPIQSNLITPLRLTGYGEHTPADWVRGRLQVSYTPGFDRFPGSTRFGEGEVDGVFLVDALASFDVGPGQLNVGIENLLDNQFIPVRRQAFNVANSYFAAPGLTMAVSYQVEW